MKKYNIQTDDERFEFEFSFHQNESDIIESFDTKIFYVDKENGSRKILKFEQTNIKPYEQVDIEILDLKNYTLLGTISLEFIISSEGTFAGINADFRYGDKFSPIDFEGFLLYIPTGSEPVPPPVPPSPPAPPSPQPMDPEVEHLKREITNDLFPYVYMRRWPSISAEIFQQYFIKYAKSTFESPEKLLIDTLIQESDDRSKMQQDSIDFIDSKSAYNPTYLGTLQALGTPFEKFYTLFIRLYPCTTFNSDELKQATLTCFDMDEATFQNYLKSNFYLENKERCWQTYFALIFVMGYNITLMDQITGILVCTNLIEIIFNTVDEPLSNKIINDLLHATLCLPDALFPHKPNNTNVNQILNKNEIHQEGKNEIRPFAIGDLQIVKQKFLRYELGEISDIINIMKGEEKEIQDRSFIKSETYQEEQSTSFNHQKKSEEEVQKSLNQIINQTIYNNRQTAYFSDLNTTYGPPSTLTYSGTVTYRKPDNNKKNHSSYAKKILNRAVSDFSSTVSNLRSKRLTNESEKMIISKIDNRNNGANHVGIMRWVNKVYLNYVVSSGKRLMYEMFIEKPSDQFIDSELVFKGVSLKLPPSPNSLGISSATDINRANFNALNSQYHNLSAPLPDTLTLSATLNGPETKILPIKDQYKATSVSTVIIQSANDENQKVQIAIGTTILDAPASALKGEIVEIPISAMVLLESKPTSNGTDTKPTPDALVDFTINLQLTCTLSDTYLNDWQSTVYKEIMTHYELQLNHYYKVLEEQFGNHNHARNTQIIKQSIEACCKKQLYTNYLNKVNSTYKENAIANLRILQFIDTLFEWHEMYFVFIKNLDLDQKKENYAVTNQFRNDDNFFNEFILADFVQVILPVTPKLEQSALLFTETGIMWSGKNEFCSCSSSISENDGPAEIIYEVKKNHPTEIDPISDSWEIKLPTALKTFTDTTFELKEVVK